MTSGQRIAWHPARGRIQIGQQADTSNPSIDIRHGMSRNPPLSFPRGAARSPEGAVGERGLRAGLRTLHMCLVTQGRAM
jgi:hypothetical protein